jgi:hypothetical protein
MNRVLQMARFARLAEKFGTTEDGQLSTGNWCAKHLKALLAEATPDELVEFDRRMESRVPRWRMWR